MAVSALHVASYRFFLTAKDKVIIGYELQYSIQHIYEHVLVGTGDVNDPAITIIPRSEFTVKYIDKVPPNPQKTGYYRIKNGELEFDNDYDGSTFTVDESLGSKVTFLSTDLDSGAQLSEFSMDGNMLRIMLTAEFPTPRAGTKQRLTLYSACYPRLATFQ